MQWNIVFPDYVVCNGISFSLTVLCAMEYRFSGLCCVQWNIVFPDCCVQGNIVFPDYVVCNGISFSLTVLCAMEYYFP